jgi:hypothetical protein
MIYASAYLNWNRSYALAVQAWTCLYLLSEAIEAFPIPKLRSQGTGRRTASPIRQPTARPCHSKMPHRRTVDLAKKPYPRPWWSPPCRCSLRTVRIILRFDLVCRSATVVAASGAMRAASLDTGGGLLGSRLFAPRVQDQGAEDDWSIQVQLV